MNLCVKGFLINNVENDCVVRIIHLDRCARFFSGDTFRLR